MLRSLTRYVVFPLSAFVLLGPVANGAAAQARPLEQLHTVLGVSYLDSKFDYYPDATALPATIADYRLDIQALRAMGLPSTHAPTCPEGTD